MGGDEDRLPQTMGDRVFSKRLFPPFVTKQPDPLITLREIGPNRHCINGWVTVSLFLMERPTKKGGHDPNLPWTFVYIEILSERARLIDREDTLDRLVWI